MLKKATIRLIIFVLMLTGFTWQAVAEEFEHPGYISNVKEERTQVTREVVIYPLASTPRADVDTRIFTQKMNMEFSREFRLTFGHTEFEQLNVTSNRFAEEQASGRLVPVDEYIEKQEKFGQYMSKELLEYHFDNYLKSGRNTRTVYKVKEAVSNVEYVSKSGYKFKFRYKIASNRAIFKYERKGGSFSPQFDTKLSGSEPTVRLFYTLTKTIALESNYQIDDKITTLRATKRLTANMSTSLTGQQYKEAVDAETPAQERVLVGLSWND